MAKRKNSAPTPAGKEIKIEVQGDQSQTSGCCCPPPTGLDPVTYAHMLCYINNDKEAKHLPPGGVKNLWDWHPQYGFPINGLPIIERPSWIPPLYLPSMPTVSQNSAPVRRRRQATVRQRHRQAFGTSYMPVPVHPIQRPFIFQAPSAAGGTIMRQPQCSLCGVNGHNIGSCNKTA